MSRVIQTGQQTLPVTISRRTSDIGASFTGEAGSYEDNRFHMDVAMSSTPTSVHFLDELQQHYNHEADSGPLRHRSQSIGTPLVTGKSWPRARMQEGRGSVVEDAMVEDAIKLINQWDRTPATRSRTNSCSVTERYSHAANTVPQVRRISDSQDVSHLPLTASQERGNSLLHKLTGSPRDVMHRGSVSRSRSGSHPLDRQKDLEEMDESMEYLTIRTVEGSGSRSFNGQSDQVLIPQQRPANNRTPQQQEHEQQEEKRGFDLTSWTTPRPSPNMALLPRPSHTGLLVSGISSPIGQPAIGQTAGLEMLTSFLPALSLLPDRRWQDPIPVNQVRMTDPIEMQAKAHRASAAHSEPRCTWSGQLPVKVHKNPVYSSKVFLGGVPYDISDSQLVEAFSPYGSVKVQWPPNRPHVQQENRQQKCGYLYVIFEHDKNVKSLLQACTHDYTRSVLRYFFTLSSRRSKFKEVQVIPWAIADSNYVKSPAQRLDTQKTVFVGALHGMLTAEGLATVMHDLFGGVAYVGIDTDKNKYPIGSARVTFNNQRSYMKAVQAEFVDIKAHFNKKIQCDPYIEQALCSTCNMQQGPVFCRDPHCFRYFCRSCWQWIHSAPELDKHKPLMRYRRE